ncbi:MAG: ribosome biogenesis GTPase Der [Bacteroidota bacterium]|jgi:GTP-binding protein
MANVVAIIGRPNVGKSTMFNRLTESRQAIVDEIAGVTRDRHYGKSEWNGVEFSLIDTGGYIQGSDDVFEEEIRRQVKIAIDESTLLLFVVDVNDGVTDYDKAVASLVRKSNKPCILVANKADNAERAAYSADFYQLGLGEVYPISAINGSGTGELMDELINLLPPSENVPEEENIPRIAIVGRPNVGKSSLTNALLGEERNIVTSIAGTTRDSINTRYKAYGHDLILIDTAGIRKKAKVDEDLEFYSVMRSIKAIENSDVCVIMLDATQGIEAQDLAIFRLTVKNHKGVVIAVNKWDLEEKETNTAKEYEDFIRNQIAPFRDVPIVFTSATEKQRILKVVELAMQVYENRKRKVSTSELNDFFLPLIENYGPPAIKGKYIKVKYVTQLPNMPVFVFFCNLPQYINDPYIRFLENKLREQWNFSGVPIDIYFRKK